MPAPNRPQSIPVRSVVGQLALGRCGLLPELLGLPPRFGFDCGGGPLLQIESRGLGNVNLGFGPAPPVNV